MDNLSDETAILIHLSNLRQDDQNVYFSGFMGGLRDARKFTARDQDTGVKIQNSNIGDHGSWLGTIGYMAILDQIGNCFKPKGTPKLDGSSIVKSFGYFTNMTRDEANAIYALRCAFAHDFSLFNVNPNKPFMNHLFTVYKGDDKQVVTLPQIKWNGDYNNLDPDCITYVNLEAFGDTVEDIYYEMVRLSKLSQLEIVLPGGAEELLRRYSIYSPVSR